MNTRKYETLYLVSPALEEADVQKIADRFKEVVERNGGTVEAAGLWEKRKLAYPIKNLDEANYILMTFEAPATTPKELGRLMRISDDVIRHRIFLRDE